VTGDAPVVDVQSVRREFVVNKDMMETLPVGRSLTGQIVLIAGVTGAPHGRWRAADGAWVIGERDLHVQRRYARRPASIGAGISQGGWGMSEAASA